MRSLLTIICGVLILQACSTHEKNLATAEGTFDEAERLMKDEFFEEARKQYNRIKTDFATSPLQLKATLRIADSYYEEESYTIAATSYDDFVRLYPAREETPYAMYRLGMCYRKQMPDNPLRDTRPTEKVLDTFTRLMIDYPQTQYGEKAKTYIKLAQEQLAEKSYEIGRFYEKTEKYESAALRYGEVTTVYPDSDLAEESMARQVRALRLAKKTDNAEEVQSEFMAKYPSSKFKYMVEK